MIKRFELKSVYVDIINRILLERGRLKEFTATLTKFGIKNMANNG